ncbi:MAG: c-type cytochrome [Ardenticatenia bacterium]|nr:c-type cytochrome [Ardenticatenia bacterium]
MKRWFLRILGGLVVVLALAALSVYVLSERRLARTYKVPQDEVAIPTDEEGIARGAYLATSISNCRDCHGKDLSGGIMVDDGALGRISAPNLTTGEGGIGEHLENDDLVRAIRYGVAADGTALKIMPADDFNSLSDEDLGAIIAYVRSVPPVDELQPSFVLRPLGRTLVALGQLEIFPVERIDLAAPRPKTLKPEVSKVYGKYLAQIAGCTGCHGPGLSGGQIPGAPPDFPQAANLTPSGDVGDWRFQDFLSTIRSGKNPKGHSLAEEMPWRNFAGMSDQELRAIWLFVASVPAREAGTR